MTPIPDFRASRKRIELSKRWVMISLVKILRIFLRNRKLRRLIKRIRVKKDRSSHLTHYEFQVDLIYIENTHLNNASYGLVCVDIFSKKGDVELMKRKSAPEVAKAFAKILERMGKPEYVMSDEGSEFQGEFKKL